MEVQHTRLYFIQDLRTKNIGCFPIPQHQKKADSRYDGERTNLKQWIKENENYGILCGHNNIFVIDADYDGEQADKDFAEFETLKVETPNRRRHFIFQHTGKEMPRTRRLKNNAGQQIDFQSVGSYVVGPGSEVYPDPLKNKIDDPTKLKQYKVISNKPILKINAQEIIAKLESLGYKIIKKPIEDLRKPSSVGSRNKDLFDYLKEYRKINPEISFEFALQLAKDRNELNNPPMDLEEVETIVKHSFNYDYSGLAPIKKPIEPLKVDDPLKRVIEICSLTVKNDESLVSQILMNGLSKQTSKPTHLMIKERSSEGKTYPVLQIAEKFPQEDIITLASVTPQSFKYEHGVLVDENYKPIQKDVDDMYDELDELNADKKTNAKKIRELKKKLRETIGKSKTLIDLRGKWIIFKEPPNTRLLEMLYSTLSSDEEYSEHKVVPDSGKGKRQTLTIVIRGTPAITICTARDETQNKRWEETFTRFAIVSPQSTQAKYKAGLDLIAKAYGLPKEIYNEYVINDDTKKEAKNIINYLLDRISQTNGEVLNLFQKRLSELYPSDVGYRWREYQRFNNLLRLRTLCYYDERPLMRINGKNIPVVTLDDVKWSLKHSKESEVISPNKIKWYNDTFKQVFKKKSTEVNFGTKDKPDHRNVIIIKDIVDYCKENGLGKPTTKQIRENYLNELYEHGYIEKDKDPRVKSRDAYWLVEESQSKKSPSIAESSFDTSCLESCLDEYKLRRFEYTYKNEKIDFGTLIKIAIQDPEFVPKNGNGETAMNGDLKQETLGSNGAKGTASDDDEQRETAMDDDSELVKQSLENGPCDVVCVKCNCKLGSVKDFGEFERRQKAHIGAYRKDKSHFLTVIKPKEVNQ